jgi:hydrogenase nickel incorporation protein HypA/HybF
MHELAVCQGLMSQVRQIAQRERALRVTSITLQIGALSGVEPRLLRDAFPFAAAGSVAQGAQLQIEDLPVQVQCIQCGAHSEVQANRLVCGACGDYRTRLVSGDEMLLKSLELERETLPEVPDQPG